MTDYVRSVLYLGNRADSDPVEGAPSYYHPNVAGAENPGALLGTYDASDGLAVTQVQFSDVEGVRCYDGYGPNGVIEENYVYDSYTGDLLDYGTHDSVSYDVGAGACSTRLDNVQIATVTVHLADGSCKTLDVVISQMTNGDVFISEKQDAPHSLDNLQIVAIDVHCVDHCNYSGLIIPPNICSTVVCFVGGTLIETANGPMPVDELQIGDLVHTRDNGLQPIRWIGKRNLKAHELEQNAKLRPITISAGALAPNVPEQDLQLSPQHRVLVRSRIAERMFGSQEVLVAAKQLCEVDGISVCKCKRDVVYFHIMFDQHEIVLSNGAETESFFTGPMALRSITPEAKIELFSLFPELADVDHTPVSARPLAAGRVARQLAFRHAKNEKPLVN